MISRIAILTLLVGVLSSAHAQYRDQELWAGATVKYSLNKQIRFDVEEQIRHNMSAGVLRQNFMEFGVQYKYNKYFSGRAFLRAIGRSLDHGRTRLGFDLKATFNKKGIPFIPKYRFRFQNSTETYTRQKGTYMRHLIGMKVKVSKLVDPYAGFEVYHRLNGLNHISTLRCTFGLEWRLHKRLDLETFFRVDEPKNQEDPVTQVIYGLSLSYDLKFKKKKEEE